LVTSASPASALSGRNLVTWGDRLRWWNPPGAAGAASIANGPFAEGGAILDVNGDGRPDIVLNEGAPGRALVWREAPRWTRHVIDTGVDTADALAAELFGRRGILVVHRHAQVRFYEIPHRASNRWPMREIYSFYTPSDQGGLLRADVDGDGRQDTSAAITGFARPKVSICRGACSPSSFGTRSRIPPCCALGGLGRAS
jgi:hypothetical protein